MQPLVPTRWEYLRRSTSPPFSEALCHNGLNMAALEGGPDQREDIHRLEMLCLDSISCVSQEGDHSSYLLFSSVIKGLTGWVGPKAPVDLIYHPEASETFFFCF